MQLADSLRRAGWEASSSCKAGGSPSLMSFILGSVFVSMSAANDSPVWCLRTWSRPRKRRGSKHHHST